MFKTPSNKFQLLLLTVCIGLSGPGYGAESGETQQQSSEQQTAPAPERPADNLRCTPPFEQIQGKSEQAGYIWVKYVRPAEVKKGCILHDRRAVITGLKCLMVENDGSDDASNWWCPVGESCFGHGTFLGITREPTDDGQDRTCFSYRNDTAKFIQEAGIQIMWAPPETPATDVAE